LKKSKIPKLTSRDFFFFKSRLFWQCSDNRKSGGLQPARHPLKNSLV
jgi:hypothetical protein